jgi:hypothetical protein
MVNEYVHPIAIVNKPLAIFSNLYNNRWTYNLSYQFKNIYRPILYDYVKIADAEKDYKM